ncbi:MAG: hypothetical protein BWY43_00375 [candidate division WS2 bacterium ADurb.Bin280]|uniref:Uncharacterized protein n=1 Tax=candidate division WS2 bacterium ADurb.Bin280 TaxID=1852829 RepID=A0A1V5SDZ5_9BACT|nr:MAG: hypothetical protein BWY43_00375 [candidate division WS2 bacterium ADurb.Bin280]
MEPWLHGFFKALPELLSGCEGLTDGKARKLKVELYRKKWFLSKLGELCATFYLQIRIASAICDKPQAFTVECDLTSPYDSCVAMTIRMVALEPSALREAIVSFAGLLQVSLEAMGPSANISYSVFWDDAQNVRRIVAFQNLAMRAGLERIFEEDTEQ